MTTALFFIALAFIFIIGGAMLLLDTAKKPRIPPNIKTPEELDKEDQDWKN